MLWSKFEMLWFRLGNINNIRDIRVWQAEDLLGVMMLSNRTCGVWFCLSLSFLCCFHIEIHVRFEVNGSGRLTQAFENNGAFHWNSILCRKWNLLGGDGTEWMFNLLSALMVKRCNVFVLNLFNWKMTWLFVFSSNQSWVKLASDQAPCNCLSIKLQCTSFRKCIKE